MISMEGVVEKVIYSSAEKKDFSVAKFRSDEKDLITIVGNSLLRKGIISGFMENGNFIKNMADSSR